MYFSRYSKYGMVWYGIEMIKDSDTEKTVAWSDFL